jgi:phosphoribosylformimino-5-aminoimidazole carboxamide ribonucleotide (ProFAR) isomerase
VSDVKDFPALEEAGTTGVIFGKAYYEGRISDADISNYLKTG